MFFDNLGAIMNDNGGCDLQGIDLIGTSNITATARYPYQPVTDPAKTSTPLVKVVHSLFDKNLTYWPKGPGAENDVARIVVAHAQDITGAGFDHERVCFMARLPDRGHEGVHRHDRSRQRPHLAGRHVPRG